jgi:hypothetical protein
MAREREQAVVVGTFTVTEPWTVTDSSYQCAAWWRTLAIEPGTYEVVRHRATDMMLSVRLNGTIIEDYFGARLGASLGAYNTKQNAGKPDTFVFSRYSWDFEKDPRFATK